MSILHFDGADDYVQSATLGLNIAGAFSILAVIKRGGVGTFQSIITNHDATVPRMAFEFNTSNQLQVEIDGGSSAHSTTTITDTTDTWAIGYSKAAGATTGRFHFKNMTTGATAVHEVGVNSIGNPTTQAGGFIKIGNYATTNNDDFNGDIGLVAELLSELTDGNYDTLFAAHTTSAVVTMAAAGDLVAECNASTPVDRKGTTTFNAASGATLTGTNPTNWTLDGGGAGTPLAVTVPGW